MANSREEAAKPGLPKSLRPMYIWESLLLFGIPAIWLWVITRGIIPILTQQAHWHPALAWFACAGLLFFLPLLLLAIGLTRREGVPLRWADLAKRWRLRAMTKKDWGWTLAGIIGVSIGSVVIMLAAQMLHAGFGLPVLKTTPPFLEFDPFQGAQRWMLLAWLPMFALNIFGEEVLWRGYILPRQEAAYGNKAWMLNAGLWTVIHSSFGLGLVLLLLPILILQTYIVGRQKNTWIGMWIHGLLNGPSFVMISLGIIG